MKMTNPEFNGIDVDMAAFRRHMELQLVCSLLRLNTDVPEDTQQQMQALLEVFERHGIGVKETFDILRELQVIYGD